MYELIAGTTSELYRFEAIVLCAAMSYKESGECKALSQPCRQAVDKCRAPG